MTSGLGPGAVAVVGLACPEPPEHAEPTTARKVNIRMTRLMSSRELSHRKGEGANGLVQGQKGAPTGRPRGASVQSAFGSGFWLFTVEIHTRTRNPRPECPSRPRPAKTPQKRLQAGSCRVRELRRDSGWSARPR